MTAGGAGGELEGQTDVLEALDWHPEEPKCEFAEHHQHLPATRRVIFPCCPTAVLGCETCWLNWKSHVAVCPECNPGGRGRCARCHVCQTISHHFAIKWERLP